MAVISMFYGIIVYLFFEDNKRHHLPHIHVKYQDENAVFSIPDGELLEGTLKPNKIKLLQAWVEIHAEELQADWDLAISGQKIFKIDPLK
ncbi:MAG: DUF4160 domain-containing protein [Prevotellaceae bacterium]|jgi:hypothetical protein|nr:DUF4160 domain-containing protein [Prevotellaceae bacterium]